MRPRSAPGGTYSATRAAVKSERSWSTNVCEATSWIGDSIRHSAGVFPSSRASTVFEVPFTIAMRVISWLGTSTSAFERNSSIGFVICAIGAHFTAAKRFPSEAAVASVPGTSLPKRTTFFSPPLRTSVAVAFGASSPNSFGSKDDLVSPRISMRERSETSASTVLESAGPGGFPSRRQRVVPTRVR